mmetsp:Transcript_118065/g.333913  ORF Transcript_118065/g.333913 Transcript_118065/m.333913 type:complete len:238 (+) Transcript_118065:86-799(+)
MESHTKRPPPDPRGPVLELLQAFGVRERGGYYDGKVRGKVMRFDNIRQIGAAASKGSAGKGAARNGYGGGRHRRAAEAGKNASEAPAGAESKGRDGGAKSKEAWSGLSYEDFEPLRELWASYVDDMQAGSGPALAEALAAADLHGSIVEVVQSRHPGCVRLRGTVLEETQRTIRIITPDNRVRVLPKATCVFEVEARGERIRMLGPAWAHRLPGGVPGPYAPQRWTLAPQRLTVIKA